MQIKTALILCAGYGKRLNPLTLTKPKPLLKIGNETLLSNTLKFLKFFGIEHVPISRRCQKCIDLTSCRFLT